MIFFSWKIQFKNWFKNLNLAWLNLDTTRWRPDGASGAGGGYKRRKWRIWGEDIICQPITVKYKNITFIPCIVSFPWRIIAQNAVTIVINRHNDVTLMTNQTMECRCAWHQQQGGCKPGTSHTEALSSFFCSQSPLGACHSIPCEEWAALWDDSRMKAKFCNSSTLRITKSSHHELKM